VRLKSRSRSQSSCSEEETTEPRCDGKTRPNQPIDHDRPVPARLSPAIAGTSSQDRAPLDAIATYVATLEPSPSPHADSTAAVTSPYDLLCQWIAVRARDSWDEQVVVAKRLAKPAPFASECEVHSRPTGHVDHAPQSSSGTSQSSNANERTGHKKNGSRTFSARDIPKDGDENGGDEEGENPRPSKRLCGPNGPERRGQLSFACPFGKNDAIRYRRCLTHFGFDGFNRVKQHVLREHWKHYCVRCKRVFDGSRGLDEHFLARQCPVLDEPLPEGLITNEQKQAIQEIGNGRSPVTKWYDAYGIIFGPGAPVPASCFISDEMFDRGVFQGISQGLQARAVDLIRYYLARFVIPPDFALTIAVEMVELLFAGSEENLMIWIQTGILNVPEPIQRIHTSNPQQLDSVTPSLATSPPPQLGNHLLPGNSTSLPMHDEFNHPDHLSPIATTAIPHNADQWPPTHGSPSGDDVESHESSVPQSTSFWSEANLAQTQTELDVMDEFTHLNDDQVIRVESRPSGSSTWPAEASSRPHTNAQGHGTGS
jgi:hypothetical protein